MVTEFHVSISNIKVNKMHMLRLVQVYMPTSDYDDKDVEKVYETVEEILQAKKAYYKL